MNKTAKLLLIVALTVSACSPTRGCIESSFTLSADCRLPRWFKTPPTANRLDYEVTMDYWIGQGRTATVKLQNHWGLTADSVVADLFGNEPLVTGPTPKTGHNGYPAYALLTARGLTEVIEHRRMEPIFCISDDADVRQKLFQKYKPETLR